MNKEKLKILFERYERPVSLASFLIGFAVDNLTLTRVDLFFDNLVLIFYLVVSGTAITIVNFYDERNFRADVEEITHMSARAFAFLRTLAPFFMQYAFGGLFSGIFVFYSHGSSLAASWPFLVVLGGLLVGNEFLRKKYHRLTFQASVFFFVLYSYMIFAVPMVVGRIGVDVFLLSGVVSVFGITALLFGYRVFSPKRVEEAGMMLVVGIGSIVLAINILYFLNIIPPLPLSLKEAGVYHVVERVSEGGYRVMDEERPWYAVFLPYTQVHIVRGGTLYFYSAVFAPTRLSATPIVHRWQFYDEASGAWITRSRVEFAVLGGRDGGYRGYSLKTNVEPGTWRVRVETTRGQVLGQVKFTVVEVVAPVLFEEKIL